MTNSEENRANPEQISSIPEVQQIQTNTPVPAAQLRLAPSPPFNGLPGIQRPPSHANAHYIAPQHFGHHVAPNPPMYMPSTGAILMAPPPAILPRSRVAEAERGSPISSQPSSKRKQKQVSRKAKTIAPKRRKFADGDSLTIIYYWRDHYEQYAKSNKKAFAKKASEELNRDYFSKQVDNTPITGDRIQNLLLYCTKRYKEVVKKFHDSGHGLKEDDPETLKESAEKSVKHFWVLHSFLAPKANINPPVLLQPRQNEGHTHLDIDQAFGKLDRCTNPEGNEPSSGEESRDSLVLEIEAVLAGEGSEQPKSTEKRNKRGATGSSAGNATVAKKRRMSTPSGSKLKRLSLDKPRRNSGTAVVEGQTSKDEKFQGKSEPTAGNSASRLQMVNDMYSTQQTHKNTQTANLGKVVNTLEKESLSRQQEVTIMAKSTELKELESKYLQREQERRDREEKRMEREEKRKEDEAAREKVVLKRTLVMDEAEQLRKQASMFQTLNMSGKAIECMNKAETLVETLRSISYMEPPPEVRGGAGRDLKEGVDDSVEEVDN